MRKILVLLLVFGLVLGFAGVVSAGETLTITGPNTGNIGTEVTFSVTKQDNITYSWTIDNDSAGSSESIKKKFDSAGKYIVKVTASGTNQSAVEATKEITIKPVASISVSKDSGNAPLNVTFTGSPTSGVTYLWTFESDRTSTDANPTYNFTTAKKYSVSLVVTQNGISSDTVTKEINVTEKVMPVPVTEIDEVSPTRGVAPLNVTFKATATDSTSVKWEFGDGDSSTTARTTHIYQNPGTYVANFTATNKNGSSVKKSETIVVQGNKSTYKVAIDATPVKGVAPLTVKFKLNTTIPTDQIHSEKGYEWDFGYDSDDKDDLNEYSYDRDPKDQTYSKDGTYTVKVTVKTILGDPYSAEIKITVSDLVASFDASKTSGPAPLDVKFTDTSSGPTSWKWTIYKTSDGSRTSLKELTSRNITYTFDQEGKYEVELAAIKGSKTVTTYKEITVSAKATTAPTTKPTTKATTAPTTAATTSQAVKAAALSSDDNPVPNPMDIIEEFIRLIKVMLVPENYNLAI